MVKLNWVNVDLRNSTLSVYKVVQILFHRHCCRVVLNPDRFSHLLMIFPQGNGKEEKEEKFSLIISRFLCERLSIELGFSLFYCMDQDIVSYNFPSSTSTLRYHSPPSQNITLVYKFHYHLY